MIYGWLHKIIVRITLKKMTLFFVVKNSFWDLNAFKETKVDAIKRIRLLLYHLFIPNFKGSYY